MGYRIREVRNKLNISQETLAAKSGVSRTTISKLETDDKAVTTTDTLMSIAKALGVSITELFFDKTV